MSHSFRLSLGAIFFAIAIFATHASAEPFAPRVNIPDEMLQEGHDAHFDAMTAKKSTIPSSEEVGFPSYPEARILFTQMNNQLNEGGKTIDLPKRIFMGTPDSVEQVVEFYQKNLQGWRYEKIYGAPTFYKKDGKYDPLKDMTTPRIVIAPEFRTRKLMPESKTTIDIYYK